MGMSFLEKIQLYTKNKYLLVDRPSRLNSNMPTLKWIGSPRSFIDFTANGTKLVRCADTGSDLNLMPLRCAKRHSLEINTTESARTQVMLADESVITTVGQTRISSVSLPGFNNEESFKMSFHVLPNLASDIIFSEEFLEQVDVFHTCARIKDSSDP
ncbi:hypothetical protein G7Y89_g3561 [Cudoniella acicularis]|uniref:Uncharacterized protein n=1 Tax=Cudoniella acicularis TaxID=354080 RepID=A0A8H4RSC7_9HELO|nr:hypothetical protein G7Y89_g3561 [Cudoniella acicularis]